MQLLKFRIKNYKSIIDSGDCYVDERITILAGKNEAGKTAILEALEDFNRDKPIREEAKPLWDENAFPKIRVSMKLDSQEIKKLNEKFKVNGRNIEVINITKQYPNTYIVESLSDINPKLKNLQKIEEDISKLAEELKNKLPNFPISKESVKSKGLDILLREIDTFSQNALNALEPKERDKVSKKLREFKQKIISLQEIDNFKNEFHGYVIQNLIPNFILFRTFEDILPNQIPIAQVSNNSIVKDLFKISGINLSMIQPSADIRKRIKEKEKINIKFKKEYQSFWTQDHSHLYMDLDSNSIYFFVKEGKEYYKPEVRSKGRQWHLSFYIRVTARSLEGNKNIILIDDPGLFLHAKAQRDILEKLETTAEKNQIIYATHSPYLIPSKNLGRVRLVIKDDKEGTKIKKITAKADKETITPILTAIGEDISVGIRVDKKNSVIVEGYSDYLWLRAWEKLLDIDYKIYLIPAVGADSSIYIGCILIGWGLDPIFIFDNDGKGKQVAKKLKEKVLVDDERIIFVPERRKGRIEDLFVGDDKKYTSNKNKSKVLLAQDFYIRVEKGEITTDKLSQDTKHNFQQIFDKLKKILSE